MVSLLDAMQSNFESGLSPHVETASANIRVAVRIRPLNYEEGGHLTDFLSFRS